MIIVANVHKKSQQFLEKLNKTKEVKLKYIKKTPCGKIKETNSAKITKLQDKTIRVNLSSGGFMDITESYTQRGYMGMKIPGSTNYHKDPLLIYLSSLDYSHEKLKKLFEISDHDHGFKLTKDGVHIIVNIKNNHITVSDGKEIIDIYDVEISH